LDTDTTNLVDGGDTSTETLTNDTGVVADDQVTDTQQFDENGDPIAQAIEEEEVDFDDLKLKVPKDHAQKVREALLRQADYTRKTQEVAEMRKAVEAERQSIHQSSQQEIAAAATVVSIDQQLAEYANIDWAREMQAARQNYDQDRLDLLQTEFARFTQLKDQRGQAAQNYTQAVQKRLSDAQQDTAKRMEEARTAIAKEITNWDEVGPKVMEAAVKHYRFTADELNALDDPRHAIVLNDARQWREHLAKTKAAERHTQAQQAAPAAKASGGSAVPANKLDDRLSTEEWMRRRDEQDRKRRS
jgi:hypothetical protein